MISINRCLNRFNLFVVLSLLAACQSKVKTDDTDALKGHLPSSLVGNPRSIVDDTLALQGLGNLSFSDTIHDFGNVSDGEMLTYDFEFENIGQKDILISEATASCGCTVPSFPQQPIKSGEKNKISVTFNSQGRKGYNEKMIIVNTNGNPSVYNLYIRAAVDAK